ncbi:MAG: RNA degradosome polyphosphate kinase, partial [Lachnospiraceae bacterium]
MNDKYTNRELSWLDFNYRILSEARDKTNPLLERAKFLSITASNLDEFFMIRVASLKDMVNAEYNKKDIADMTPLEQLSAISEKTHDFVNLQYSTYGRSLVQLLKGEGLNIVQSHEDLNEVQKEYVDKYFKENIYPILTPMAVDSSRPFPLIRNKTLNIAALLEKNEDIKQKADSKRKGRENSDAGSEIEFATVQVPSVIPRIVKIPSITEGETTVILLEEIIERHIQKLFLNYRVVCAHPYRVMRNADLTIDEEDAADLLKEIQKQLKKRQWGEVIRLEIEDKMDKRLVKILKEELAVSDEDIFNINGPL